MKYYIFVSTCFFFIHAGIFAQVKSLEISAGPSYNFSWKDHGTLSDTLETLTTLNTNVGISAVFSLGNSLDLLGGVRYQTKGQKYEYCYDNGGNAYECSDKTLKINLNYIEIPLFLRYYFMQSNSTKVFLGLGMQFNTLAKATDNYADFLENSGDVSQRYNSNNLSTLFGIGVSRKISKKLNINFSWNGEWGLSKVFASDAFPSGATFVTRGTPFVNQSSANQKHLLTSVQIGLQYYFSTPESDETQDNKKTNRKKPNSKKTSSNKNSKK